MPAPLAAICLLLLVLLAGCSSLPVTHYYVIELDPPAAASGAAPSVGAGAAETAGWSIGVRPFAVDAPYDQERIVYRVGERSPEVGFYAYHVWAAPLQSMLAAAVAAALTGAEGVAELEPVVVGRRYDAFLHGRVLAMEEVDLSDRQRVLATIELRLHAADGTELWSRVIEARGETRTEEVADIVEAFGAALAEALDGARVELGEAVSRLDG